MMLYFELPTDRIVTETELKLAYEIVNGCEADKNPEHFNDWANRSCSCLGIYDESEITIEQLVKGKAFAQAIKLCKKQHNCTLDEAKELCVKIRINCAFDDLRINYGMTDKEASEFIANMLHDRKEN